MANSCEDVVHFGFKSKLRTLKSRVRSAPDTDTRNARCNACISEARKVARPTQKELNSFCGAQSEDTLPMRFGWTPSRTIRRNSQRPGVGVLLPSTFLAR